MRDWWAYGEMFGLPVRVGTYNAQTATDTDIKTLTAAVAALAADAGCVIPDSMAIDVQQPGMTNSGDLVMHLTQVAPISCGHGELARHGARDCADAY